MFCLHFLFTGYDLHTLVTQTWKRLTPETYTLVEKCGLKSSANTGRCRWALGALRLSLLEALVSGSFYNVRRPKPSEMLTAR